MHELQLHLQIEWPVMVDERKREVCMVISSYSTAGIF